MGLFLQITDEKAARMSLTPPIMAAGRKTWVERGRIEPANSPMQVRGQRVLIQERLRTLRRRGQHEGERGRFGREPRPSGPRTEGICCDGDDGRASSFLYSVSWVRGTGENAVAMSRKRPRGKSTGAGVEPLRGLARSVRRVGR